MSDAQLGEVPLGSGLDETQEDAFVPAEKMRVCQNVVFPDDKTAAKRPGLATIALQNYVRALVSRGNDLIAIDGQNAYEVDLATGSTYLRGGVSPFTISRTVVGTGSVAAGSSLHTGGAPAIVSAPVPLSSVAEGGGYRVVVWNDGTYILASIYSLASKVWVTTATVLSSVASTNVYAGQPRALIIGTTVIALWVDNNASFLTGATLSLSAIGSGWGAPVQMLSTGLTSSSVSFDASVVGGTSNFTTVLSSAQYDAAPSYRVFVHEWSTALSVVHSATVATGSSTGLTGFRMVSSAINACPGSSDGVLLLAWTDVHTSGGVESYKLNVAGYAIGVGLSSYFVSTIISDNNSGSPAQASQFTAVAIERLYGQGSSATSQFIVTYSRAVYDIAPPSGSGGSIDATFPFTALFTITVNTGSTGISHGPFQAYQIMSKPFAVTVNGALSIFQHVMRLNDSPQPSHHLVEIQWSVSGVKTTWIPRGVFAPRYASSNNLITTALNCDVANSGNLTAGTYTLTSYFESQVVGSTSALYTLNFNDWTQYQSVRIGPYAYFTGGLTCMFDGSAVYEAGFLHAPQAPSIRPDNAAGSLTASTTYGYAVVFSTTDGAGNVCRSAPSLIASAATGSGGSNQMQLAVMPMRTTLRTRPISIEVYRNTAATPSIFYLAHTFVNDPTNTTSFGFTDGIADTSIASNPILYTLSGGVPSVCPPASTSLGVHADRVWAIDETGLTHYFSSQLTTGEPPRFADAFTQSWPEGPITAAWSLEGRLHAATSEKIFYLFGEGPSIGNSGNDLTDPTIWRADLGIVDARGVSLCEPGAILHTQKGLYLEGRDGSYTWLSSIRRTLATYPVVTGMTALDADGAVRINMAQAAGYGQAGVTAHFDYRHARWATHTLIGGFSISSACMAAGTYVAFSPFTAGPPPGGAIFQETPSTFLDSGTTFVPSNLVTGWSHGGGMQGFQRIHRVMVLGIQNTPCQVTMQIARDFSSSFGADAQTWTDTQLSGVTQFQLQTTAGVQKCESFSVQISDASPMSGLGTGQGATFQSLNVRFRGKRGEYKQIPGNERR
jgi:hypothetical protein